MCSALSKTRNVNRVILCDEDARTSALWTMGETLDIALPSIAFRDCGSIAPI